MSDSSKFTTVIVSKSAPTISNQSAPPIINKLTKHSQPKWTLEDQTLLDELLARRNDFREQQDASIAEFLDRIALSEIYKHWRILEKNADEVIALLKPFSRLTSSS